LISAGINNSMTGDQYLMSNTSIFHGFRGGGQFSKVKVDAYPRWTVSELGRWMVLGEVDGLARWMV